MKRLFVALSVLVGATFFISSQANAQAVLWQEGKHFNVIAEEASAKPVIKEFFSFWCPACYAYESVVSQMKERLPEGAKFQKIHVNFMRFNGPQTQDDATKAMLIARTLKQEDKLNAAVFTYIHKQKATIANLDDLRKLFIVNGVEPEKFDKVAASFSVNSLVKRNNKTIDKFREHLKGVPNFIVNDKYQATFTRDMTPDQMIDLIIWLSEKK